MNCGCLLRRYATATMKIRPMPQITKALVDFVDSRQEEANDDFMNFAAAPSSTESAAEFVAEWKYGKPYYPKQTSREQVSEKMKAIVFEHYGLHLPARAEYASRWTDIMLEDADSKFAILSRAMACFEKEIPNNELDAMKTVGEAIDFFSIPEAQPVELGNPVEELFKGQTLPRNVLALPYFKRRLRNQLLVERYIDEWKHDIQASFASTNRTN